MTINKYNAMQAENVKMYLKGEITAAECHKKGLKVLETILAERSEESEWTASHWNCTADAWFDTGDCNEESANLAIYRSLEEAEIFEKYGYENTVTYIMQSIAAVRRELAA